MKSFLSFYYFLSVFLIATVVAAAPIPLKLNTNLFDPYGTGFLTAPCSIDGLARECFIDTGARVSFVKHADFKDYEKIGEEMGGGAHGKTELVDLINIERFQFGDLDIGPKVFRRASQGFISKTNLIGNDIYRDKFLVFDFVEKKLWIDEEYPRVQQRLPLNSYQETWVGMPAKIGERAPVESVWDTGAGMTVVSLRLVDESPEEFTLVGEIDVKDASGVKKRAKVYNTSFEVGGSLFNDIKVIAIDFSTIREKIGPNIESIIGFNLYKQKNWLIDYHRLQWGFVEQ